MRPLDDLGIYNAAGSAFGDLGRSNVIIMGAIVLAESGGDIEAIGDNFASGHQPEDSPYRWDRGLAQINSVHGFDPELLLNDPYYNLAAARSVWNRQGWPAWSTFRGGQFREFLPRMEAAANTTEPPPDKVEPPPFSRDDLTLLYFHMYGYGQGVTIERVMVDSNGRRIYRVTLPH